MQRSGVVLRWCSHRGPCKDGRRTAQGLSRRLSSGNTAGGALSESSNVYFTATTRDLTSWRVTCSNEPPGNYYALCVPAP
jgi:hypothetical protein